MNVAQFFKEFLTRWNKENARRSEDYILGGRVAIREISNAWLAVKDVVGNEKLATQLRASDKENREVQQRNKVLNEQVRTITAKFEKLSIDHGLLQADFNQLKREVKPAPVSVYNGETVGEMRLKLIASIGEATSLRNRLNELKGVAKTGHDGLTMSESGAVASLRMRVKQLEEQVGTFRVGGHRFEPRRFVNRLFKILAFNDTPEAKLFQIQSITENADDVLSGREPQKERATIAETRPENSSSPTPEAR